MADPFHFLVANLHKPVSVRVANGDRVGGILTSVDDYSNILLSEWVSSAATTGQFDETHPEGGRKAARKQRRGHGAEEDREDNPSIRFIRGSEIKSISFSVAATTAAAVE